MKKLLLTIILSVTSLISVAQTCQAGFTYQTSGLTVSFTDASTSSNAITSWQWNFGDSQTSTSQNPSHTYASAGTYNVCLTITDNHGCHSTSCHHVTVSVHHPCHASFTFTTDTTGLTFYFNNTSSGTTASTVYTWTFGDNTTSNLENPTHTYTGPGHSLVCLYITDVTTGCHSHYCQHIFYNHHQHPHHPHAQHHHPHHPHHKEFQLSENAEEDFSIFPNPATDELNININNTSDESSEIRLADLTGKVIYSQQFQLKTGENNFSIPLRSVNIESGIYFLSFNQGYNIITRKIIVR